MRSRRTAKTLLVLSAANVGLWAVGQAVARRLSAGDPDADEFTLATVFGGATRACTARSLRRGRVIACCGGVDLDLRDAALAPGGASLDIRAIMGGVQVTVPAGWRVHVAATTRAGGVDTRVAPPEDLPEDAPTLHVAAAARMGGVMVTTGEAPVAAADGSR